MPLLVASSSIVVPRVTLNVNYPGGAERFIALMLARQAAGVSVLHDEALVCVSCEEPEDAQRVARLLEDAGGLMPVRNGRFADFAFVDDARGPIMPCPWLAFEEGAQGFTVAYAGDPQDDPHHDSMRLGQDGGVETRIDFTTGRIIERRQPVDQAPESGDEPNPLLAIALEALAEKGTRALQLDADAVTFVVRAAHASYEILITTDAGTDYFCCLCRTAAAVPEARRDAVALAITRINGSIQLGNFEMSFDDGELRFRVAADVEDCAVSHAMVHNMIGIAIYTSERYQEALMKVMFADADPAIVEAVAAE